MSAEPPRGKSGPLGARAAVVAAVALAMYLLFRLAYPPGGQAPSPPPSTRPAPTAASARAPRPEPPRAPRPERASPPDGPTPTFDPGMSREERARLTLASYLDWSRYPPTSRPARERPDRQRPHATPTRRLPLSKEGAAGPSSLHLILSQTHLYLAGDEAAALIVSCERDGASVPCSVTAASAEPGPGAALESGSPRGPAPVSFTDDGRAPDRAAGDSAWTAQVAPGKLGFTGLHGPLAITALVEAGDERGAAGFQLSYTPLPPAVFTGRARESLESGSLSLCVGMKVREPGRYLLDARVDDSSGETFAFLSFDGALATGDQEACFTLFGRLVLDEAPESPFTLRDVEGFRLLEDAFPDRETVPTLEGAAHRTRPYALSDFSPAEWDSPVKQRTVERLSREAASPGDAP